MADLNNGTTIANNEAMHVGKWSQVDVGYFSTGDASVTGVGFQPRYVQFFAAYHQGSFNSEYYSGANNGSPNSTGFSQGHAFSGSSGDQQVNAYHWPSDSMNAHYTYSGSGEIVRMWNTSSAGGTLNGRIIGSLSSLDSDGFSLSWSANYESVPVIYRAYK